MGIDGEERGERLVERGRVGGEGDGVERRKRGVDMEMREGMDEYKIGVGIKEE